MLLLLLKFFLALGPICFVLWVIEGLRDKVTLRTRWNELTPYQWCLAVGIMFAGVGLIGILLFKALS